MRITALVTRITRQMLRDRRTLALLFFAPLLILTLMYFIFHSEASDLKIVVTGSNENIAEALKQADFQVTVAKHFSKESMAKNNIDGWLQFENGNMKLTLLNDEPSRAKAVQMQLAQGLQGDANNPSIDSHYVYGDADSKIFDIFSPMLVGFFVFFFVFLIAGIALLKERTSGTLERLLVTPIKRYEIVAGYVIGYGLFALIQTIIVVLYAVNVLDIVLVGSIWLVLLTNILVALVALSLGTLLSSFATSEFQMVQFIPLVIVPQIFFTGIFPLDGMADWLQQIGKIMPLYYASDALNGIMYKGLTFAEVVMDLLILLAFAVVFITFNILSLKKYRAL
ncbi:MULTISPECIES: ABC transporter permease [unclassified Peribacillus]|uniref:ABC transporter permease n=1 Tax=unclassified Peribacillus TaxID=2675266 RepID=UPI001913D857|nr:MULTISPECIES: ABC transporter permease [unclassified Peribacillus]MBK5442445.1 ABC transporter permease [Peribacillus sp. TH24]MBK5483854.1 ABC transporter permease [Peribacillus sp. TH16]MBK5500988.1 ABC transporter permease [Peribacillus sp. TH14]WMX54035.1 ABC transporter permease [Peribacillus sp. R9-11]